MIPKGITPVSLSDFKRILVLAVILALLAAVNAQYSPLEIIDYAALFLASLYAVLFVRIIRTDREVSTGYIQSGEGGMGLLIILFLIALFDLNTYILTLVFLVSFIAFGFYLHMLGHNSVKGGVWTGPAVNVFSVAAALFILLEMPLPPESLSLVLMGYLRASGESLIPLLVYAGLFVPLYTVLLLISQELSLFSHGKSYFEITGLPFEKARHAFTALRGFTLSCIVLFAGCLAGVGFLAGLMRERNKVADEMKSVLVINIFLQAVILLSTIAGDYVAAGAAVLVSYGLYAVHRRRYGHGRG